MVVAELEVFHSRPIAPTRRVALGRLHLPVDPPPGFGGVLLGAVMAAHLPDVDPDLHDDLLRLTYEVEEGRRISQPRLRHRLQADTVGLQRSTHRLVGSGEKVALDLSDDRGSPAQQVLAAVYAAGTLPGPSRGPVMATVRQGMRWRGQVGPALIAHLSHGDLAALAGPAGVDPHSWALEVFGLPSDGDPDRRTVQRRFRELLRAAHPDHGGAREAAAQRIAELTEARRILLP
jgi:hypothetical protein